MEGFTPDQLLGLEMPPWNLFKRDLDSGEDKDPQRRAWATQARSPQLAGWNPDQLQGHHTPDQSSPPPHRGPRFCKGSLWGRVSLQNKEIQTPHPTPSLLSSSMSPKPRLESVLTSPCAWGTGLVGYRMLLDDQPTLITPFPPGFQSESLCLLDKRREITKI